MAFVTSVVLLVAPTGAKGQFYTEAWGPKKPSLTGIATTNGPTIGFGYFGAKGKITYFTDVHSEIIISQKTMKLHQMNAGFMYDFSLDSGKWTIQPNTFLVSLTKDSSNYLLPGLKLMRNWKHHKAGIQITPATVLFHSTLFTQIFTLKYEYKRIYGNWTWNMKTDVSYVRIRGLTKDVFCELQPIISYKKISFGGRFIYQLHANKFMYGMFLKVKL